ncbi:MAG: hypothetical protein LBN33_07490 [Desulfovibrio sp.]|jgi:hypothetical protein|nr:hypothetical protein [Desulfovibrio sp.]
MPILGMCAYGHADPSGKYASGSLVEENATLVNRGVLRHRSFGAKQDPDRLTVQQWLSFCGSGSFGAKKDRLALALALGYAFFIFFRR